jgi:hypothetical protein
LNKLLITCLGENTPEFHFRIITLFKTIKSYGGQLARAKFIAIFVERVDTIVKEYLISMGVQVNIVKPFENKLQRHCNKIRMLELEESYDILIALDCDTVVTRDFSSHLSDTAIRRCDSLLDPLTLVEWKYLYRYFKLPIPKDIKKIHANSAVLFIPKKYVNGLRRSWIKYARRLTDSFFTNEKKTKFSEHKYYTDQFALSLALVEQKMKVKLLPSEFNIHINGTIQSWADQLHPYILSYHHHVTSDWKLELTGMNIPDLYIREINSLLSR